MGVRPWDVSAEPLSSAPRVDESSPRRGKDTATCSPALVAERNLFRAAVTHLPTAVKKGAYGGNMVSPVKRATRT